MSPSTTTAFGALGSQKIDQIEAEAEAESDLAEEYTGDSLSSQFQQLERTHSADDDLVALKRKMGILPPEEVAAPAEPVLARVEARPPPMEKTEQVKDQEELAAALEELEAEQGEEKRKAGH